MRVQPTFTASRPGSRDHARQCGLDQTLDLPYRILRACATRGACSLALTTIMAGSSPETSVTASTGTSVSRPADCFPLR